MRPITNSTQMNQTNPMNQKLIFDLLSSSVRRELIAILHDSGSVERERLTKMLTMADAEDAHRRTRTALHHNHLPRLSEAGVVIYDDETVTPTNRLEAVASKISHFDEGDKPPVRV